MPRALAIQGVAVSLALSSATFTARAMQQLHDGRKPAPTARGAMPYSRGCGAAARRGSFTACERPPPPTRYPNPFHSPACPHGRNHPSFRSDDGRDRALSRGDLHRPQGRHAACAGPGAGRRHAGHRAPDHLPGRGAADDQRRARCRSASTSRRRASPRPSPATPRRRAPASTARCASCRRCVASSRRRWSSRRAGCRRSVRAVRSEAAGSAAAGKIQLP